MDSVGRGRGCLGRGRLTPSVLAAAEAWRITNSIDSSFSASGRGRSIFPQEPRRPGPLRVPSITRLPEFISPLPSIPDSVIQPTDWSGILRPIVLKHFTRLESVSARVGGVGRGAPTLRSPTLSVGKGRGRAEPEQRGRYGEPAPTYSSLDEWESPDSQFSGELGLPDQPTLSPLDNEERSQVQIEVVLPDVSDYDLPSHMHQLSEPEERTTVEILELPASQTVSLESFNGVEHGGQNDHAPIHINRKTKPNAVPSSKISSRSAPLRSAKRIRRLAMEKARQVLQLSSGRSEYNPAISAASKSKHDVGERASVVEIIQEEAEAESPPRPFGYASISKKQINGFPVYTVQNIEANRLVLRSLGMPHREVFVYKIGSTFNGIPLSKFAIEEIMAEGDNVVVEDVCAYYDMNVRGFVWRALRISFPRDPTVPVEKGSRWITQGKLINLDGHLVIDTGLHSPEARAENILIRASNRIFGRTTELDSMVMVRALLSGYGPNCWSSVATTIDTPWTAENVVVTGGVVKSDGVLCCNPIPIYWAIAAAGFGFVYVPRKLMTPELKKAGEESKVEFEASLFETPDDPAWCKVHTKHSYVATRVELSKHQEKGLLIYYPSKKPTAMNEPNFGVDSNTGKAGNNAHPQNDAVDSSTEQDVGQIGCDPAPISTLDMGKNEYTGSVSLYVCSKCMGLLACVCAPK